VPPSAPAGVRCARPAASASRAATRTARRTQAANPAPRSPPPSPACSASSAGSLPGTAGAPRPPARSAALWSPAWGWDTKEAKICSCPASGNAESRCAGEMQTRHTAAHALLQACVRMLELLHPKQGQVGATDGTAGAPLWQARQREGCLPEAAVSSPALLGGVEPICPCPNGTGGRTRTHLA